MENITTTSGETFTYAQSCNLAWMVFVRWGRDLAGATVAWRRLMQNCTTEEEFGKLIEDAPMSGWPDFLQVSQAAFVRRVSIVLAAARPRTMAAFYDAVSKSGRDLRGIPVWVGDELAKLVDRAATAQPLTHVELAADDYAPFVERVLKQEALCSDEYPRFVAPESAQL